ncbi:uncharacterized protein TRUGW13939_00459 [Talaromyces rugulosus]|uniref:Uncharacterized protein n=1 Tax=Talaromyces rugulosus TaxID=121627 RepID=A0A7H8QIN3_TALRU|nr:uncharacterized protein TRUGW13939_00459 [Talaromyces rugulosus]QKX53381.1 hypothetical protein TRUGW13939_00459 [Talaromyces rugulosus]
MSEVLRFATSLLRLKGIRSYSLETNSIISTICYWRRQEKLGEPDITMENIDSYIKFWLKRKGITSEALKAIQQHAGSLSRGLLMTLHSLRDYSGCKSFPKHVLDLEDCEERIRKIYRRTQSPDVYDEDDYLAVKNIVDHAARSNQKSYDEQLASFSPLETASKVSGSVLLTSTNSIPPQILENIPSPIPQQPADNLDAYMSDAEPLYSDTFETDFLKEYIKDFSGLKKDQKKAGKPDAHMSDAEPLCSDATEKDFLEEHTKDYSRISRKGQIWKKEADSYKNKDYIYYVNPDTSACRHIVVSCCRIAISGKGQDIGDGTIRVRIQVEPHGKRHPNCYATKALDEDPASRLAFLIKYKPYSGPEIQRFAKSQGDMGLYAANTFVNIIADRMSLEEIATFPRRYIYLHKESTYGPELERFVGGNYTEGCKNRDR